MNRAQYIELCKRQIAIWKWALEEALKEEIESEARRQETIRAQEKKPEPPTEKQAEFLKKHGYKVPESKEIAKKWIEEIIKSQNKR